MIYENISMAIGHTPLVRLNGIEKALGLKAKLYGKVEGLNPAGSVKDRIALSMIEDAENSGKLAPGGTIIEPTSGNTGIGIASVASSRGYRVILTMPESMSVERRKLLKAYGAELVLTKASEGMKGAIAKAKELQQEIEGSIILGQFENSANPLAHYRNTGPEIYGDLGADIDVFVAGVGTGGTVTGVGRFLKEKVPGIRVVAVEPEASPVLSKGQAGPHMIQGIGAGFVPQVLDTAVYDEILPISNDDAFAYGKLIGKNEGFLVGISSGAALAAAVQVAKREEYAGKNIVVLFPDNGDRYLSTKLFDEE